MHAHIYEKNWIFVRFYVLSHTISIELKRKIDIKVFEHRKKCVFYGLK